jgi:tetratricopeptide (TPR) repeat protein
MNQWEPQAVDKALAYFERAVAREPDFAAGHVGLAYAYTFLLTLGRVNKEEAMARARKAAARAEELDPGGGEALMASADIKLFLDWDFDGAAEAFQKALSVTPGFAQLHHDYSFLLRITADSDGAISALEKATGLDPLSSPYNNALANAYTAAGRFEDAAAQFERTLDTDPDFYPALEGRGWLLLHSGDVSGAIATFRALRAGNPQRERCLGSLGFASGLAGESDVARECLAELHRWREDGRGTHPSFEMALVHAGLGELDEAFRHLGAALEERDGSMLFLRTSVRGWAGLREDPRFEDLLRKIGLI